MNFLCAVANSYGIGHPIARLSSLLPGATRKERPVKVLVTGGTGFTGLHPVRELVAADHEVRLLVRDPAKVRTAFEADGFIPQDVVVGDMTDEAAGDEAL